MSPNLIPHATLAILPIDNPQLLLVIGDHDHSPSGRVKSLNMKASAHRHIVGQSIPQNDV